VCIDKIVVNETAQETSAQVEVLNMEGWWRMIPVESYFKRSMTRGLEHLRILSTDLVQLRFLKYLGIIYFKHEELPESLGELVALERLEIRSDSLIALPESLGRLQALEELVIDCPSLTRIPESIGQLGALRRLCLDGCKNLEALPDSVGRLPALEELDLSYCVMEKFLGCLRELPRLKCLSIYECYSSEAARETLGLLRSMGVEIRDETPDTYIFSCHCGEVECKWFDDPFL
jgi:hypothetical protein